MKKILSKRYLLLCVLVLLIAQTSFVALAVDAPPIIVDPFATDVGPTFNSVDSAAGTVGAAFTYTITTAGTPPIIYSAAGLPDGLLLSGATISGTPTTADTSSVTLTAENDIDSDTMTLTITIEAEAAAEPEPEPEPVAPPADEPPALTLPPAEVPLEIPAPATVHAAAPKKATSVPIKSMSKSGPEIIVIALASALMGAGYRRFKKTK